MRRGSAMLTDAQIYRVEGNMMQKVASYGSVPDGIPLGEIRRISRGSTPAGLLSTDKQSIFTTC